MQPFGAPSLQDLSKYGVNNPNQWEAVKYTFYDQQAYAQAGQTQLLFFQIPQGQSSKTLADTNMVSAGQLPQPQFFFVTGIEIQFWPGVLPAVDGTVAQTLGNGINDQWYVSKTGWLNFYIGSKSYLTEGPIGRFPPRTGLIVSSSGFGTAASGVAVNYANMGGRGYDLAPGILLQPNQNFSLSLNWPTAQAISAAGRIGAFLNGILYRQSQ